MFVTLICMFFNVCGSQIVSTTQNEMISMTRYESLNQHQFEIKSPLNIMIAMAINCKYDINKVINSLQHNPKETNLFWYFNVYNSDKCGSIPNKKRKQLLSNPQIQIIEKPIWKNVFWTDHLKPDDIKAKFNSVNMDYIWLIDDDMLLEYFNFNTFISIAMKTNSAISQPTLLSRCSTCRGSDYKHLNSHNDFIVEKYGLLARSTCIIEMGAPLFKFEAWKIVQPLIVKQFRDNNDLKTEWGEDLWWCGAVKKLMNGICSVIYNTPLVHMDKRAQIKSKKYKHDGMEMINRIKTQFAEFYDGSLFEYTYEFYIDDVVKRYNDDCCNQLPDYPKCMHFGRSYYMSHK